MSTTETLQEKQTVRNGWLDYLLMLVFIPVLHKKYPAHSQEPVQRTAWVIVYLIKTPFQAMSIYIIGEYLLHDRVPSRLETFLFTGAVISFYELLFHRVIHINKQVLKLLQGRRIRQRTQAFMKENSKLSEVLIWVNTILIIAYACFFIIYLGLIILTPMGAQ